jgi:hypothetical protein
MGYFLLHAFYHARRAWREFQRQRLKAATLEGDTNQGISASLEGTTPSTPGSPEGSPDSLSPPDYLALDTPRNGGTANTHGKQKSMELTTPIPYVSPPTSPVSNSSDRLFPATTTSLAV